MTTTTDSTTEFQLRVIRAVLDNDCAEGDQKVEFLSDLMALNPENFSIEAYKERIRDLVFEVSEDEGARDFLTDLGIEIPSLDWTITVTFVVSVTGDGYEEYTGDLGMVHEFARAIERVTGVEDVEYNDYTVERAS